MIKNFLLFAILFISCSVFVNESSTCTVSSIYKINGQYKVIIEVPGSLDISIEFRTKPSLSVGDTVELCHLQKISRVEKE